MQEDRVLRSLQAAVLALLPVGCEDSLKTGVEREGASWLQGLIATCYRLFGGGQAGDHQE